MAKTVILDNHVVRLWKDPTKKLDQENLGPVLYWGDRVRLGKQVGKFWEVFLGSPEDPYYVKGRLIARAKPVLELAFIDVGQGDACLITTPAGKRILVDGGETQQAARYLASRYSKENEEKGSVVLDAIVVTHGDADHFAGLSTLVLDCARLRDKKKRIRVKARHVLHNGLVKRPSEKVEGGAKVDRTDAEMFGETFTDGDGRLYVTELVDNPARLGDQKLNKHFRRWKKAIKELKARGPCRVRRIDCFTLDAFSFVRDVDISVLAPITCELPDGGDCLPFVQHGDSVSASETINGHSVVLKLELGHVRIVLSGDLNAAVEKELTLRHKEKQLDLEAEVLKVPHHGSDDVHPLFLHAVDPMVSVVSAGDATERTDYLHPRANVLGVLGKAGRGGKPLIFITDLNAFDKYRGPAVLEETMRKQNYSYYKEDLFYARERTAYGVTHVRTDGETLFVARRGSTRDKNEAYCLSIDNRHRARAMELNKL